MNLKTESLLRSWYSRSWWNKFHNSYGTRRFFMVFAMARLWTVSKAISIQSTPWHPTL